MSVNISYIHLRFSIDDRTKKTKLKAITDKGQKYQTYQSIFKGDKSIKSSRICLIKRQSTLT